MLIVIVRGIVMFIVVSSMLIDFISVIVIVMFIVVISMITDFINIVYRCLSYDFGCKIGGRFKLIPPLYIQGHYDALPLPTPPRRRGARRPNLYRVVLSGLT